MTGNNADARKRAAGGKYDDPPCAYCPPTVRACRDGEDAARGPGFCPSAVNEPAQRRAEELCDDPFDRRVAQESARVEAVVHFAKKMGFTKIGIACCINWTPLRTLFCPGF